MLIPNVGPHKLLSYGDGATASASMADLEVRPFAVICFLEDTWARTRHVYITPGEAATFHVATEAGQIDFSVIRKSDGFMECPSRTQNLQPCSSIRSAMPMHFTPWR